MKHTQNSILFVYADASVQPTVTGLGVVIRDRRGRVLACRSKATRAMTCNEAEYAALIFALEQALTFHPTTVHAYSDSRLVVDQVLGYIAVNRPPLKSLHRQVRALQARFPQCTLTHIPRERNQLADAAADEAVRKSANAGP